LALIVTSCGPRSTESSDTQSTTKTITTVTSTTPAAPETTPVPPDSLSTLTQANLDRVQTDMSAAEVESIFGQPSSSQSQPIPIVGGTQTTYTYQNGNGLSHQRFVPLRNEIRSRSGC